MEWLIAYITAGDLEEGNRIAQHLLEQKLVACVNLVPQCQSWYAWEGRIEHSQEVLLIAKTRVEKKDFVSKAVEAVHSYECPCVVFIPVMGANSKYESWLHQQFANK